MRVKPFASVSGYRLLGVDRVADVFSRIHLYPTAKRRRAFWIVRGSKRAMSVINKHIQLPATQDVPLLVNGDANGGSTDEGG